MSKLKKSYYGQGVMKKIIGWLMVMAMIIGLAPADLNLIANAAEETTVKQSIRLYFEKPNDCGTPALNPWWENLAGVTSKPSNTAFEGDWVEITGWTTEEGSTLQVRPAFKQDTENSNLWYIDVNDGDWTGLQIVNSADGNKPVTLSGIRGDQEFRQEDYEILAAINALPTESSVYCRKNGDAWKWTYKTKDDTTEKDLVSATEKTITLHFLNTYNWITPFIDAWNTNFVTISDNDGNATVYAWGNAQKPKLKFEKDTTDENYKWYSVKVSFTGAVNGLQFADADDAKNTLKEFDAEKLEIVNGAANGADLYFGVNADGKDIVSTNEADIVIPQEPAQSVYPEYKENGNIAFTFYANQNTASVRLQGTFTDWAINEIDMVRGTTDEETQQVTYTLETDKVPVKGGLYRYGIYTGKNTYAGDPLNNVKYKGNPVIVRNPEIGNGSVTIYYPYKGTLGSGSKVLYMEEGNSGTTKEQAFTLVQEDSTENLYAAVIPASSLTAGRKYTYTIQVGDKAAVNDPYNFVARESDGTTTFTAPAVVTEPTFKSPVLNDDGTVTFNYFAPYADSVRLAGTINGNGDWFAQAKAMTKADNGVWSITKKAVAGKEYSYKFLVEGEDVVDPKNNETDAEGNSKFKTQGAQDGKESPVVDSAAQTITFNFTPAHYGLEKKNIKTVALMGTVVGENGWTNGKNLSYNEEGGYYTVTLKNVEPGEYQYKFKVTPIAGQTIEDNGYFADVKNDKVVPAGKDGAGNSIVVMPGLTIDGTNAAGAGKFQYEAVGVADEGSVKFSLKSEKPGFTMSEDGLLTVENTADTGYYEVVLDYKVDGVAKQQTQKYYYTQRALIYEYAYRTNSKYTGISDIYTWNNASYVTPYDLINYGTTANPKYVAYINADKNTSSFGYIVRLLGYWGPDQNTDREYGDRAIAMNEGDRYTKVRGGEGIENPYVLPSGQTYYDNGIVFCYRDDDKFYNGTMDTIKEAKVIVKNQETNEEQEFDMEYVVKDELFMYKFQNIPDGDYEYKFIIDGEEVQDQYNPSGVKHYEKAELEIKTSVSPEAVNYDQNPVVTVKVTNKATGKNVELSKITANLESITGRATTVDFSTITNKGVFYIDNSIKAGSYDVPITVTDLYGNTTTTTATVKVINKTSTDASWDEARVYFMLTDRFVDGDFSNNGGKEYNTKMAESYHGGDIKGVISKLGYLQQLGINTIWITPVVDNIDTIVNDELNQAAYTGYWAKDFTKLDEHLGTTEDFDQLIDEAHKRGIKIMLDIVVNHAGYGTQNSDNFGNMLRKGDEIGSDDITMQLSGLPDFKTENQEVRAKLIEWQTAWASHTTEAGNSIDYFRVDTIKHVEHETFSQLKTALAEVNPNFKMIGEYWGAGYNDTANYLGNGQMDSELDFDFKDVAANFVNGNIETAEKTLEARNAALSSNLTMGQFLSSHDEDGFLYSMGYDYGKAKLAASLQITAKGQPIVYYGEEVALSGPNAFGVYENNRYDMQFDNLKAKQKDMLAHYKKLLVARSLYSDVMSKGSRSNVLGGDGFGYEVVLREHNGETVYLAFNTTDNAKKVTIDLSKYSQTDAEQSGMVDIYSGNTLPVANGKVEITIPAMDNGGTAIIAKGKTLTDIEVVAPTKTQYEIGEELDLTNLTVTGIYGNDKAPISEGENGYSVDTSAYKSDKAGTYNITVSYEGYTKQFAVKVIAAPTATPEPTATTAPTATPTTAPTATPTPIVITPDQPTVVPTEVPTQVPTEVPTVVPTKVVTKAPTATPSYVKVKSVKLNAKKVTLGNKASITLTATVNPTNAKYKKVTWTSSNKKVATVNSKGKVTAKKVKKKTTVTITAKVKDGKTAKCKITVLPGASYKVTYKLAGGKNHGLNPTYLAKNQSLKLKTPTRKNYTFKGWYVKGKKVTTLNKKVTGNKKVTVTAKWEKVKTGAATIKSANNSSSGAITVKYAKVKGVDGYEIFCSTNKGFSKSKTTSVIAKKTKTNAKLKNLTKGTTYYVRVKAYKLDSAGNKVYGKASKTMEVEITK